jgi:ribosome-binding factor A
MSRKSRRTHSQSAKSDPFPFSEGDSPPEQAGHRQARIEHLILDELQSLLTDEATDPAVEGLRVLAVHLSVDGGHARVAYAVLAPLDREQEVGRRSKAGLTRATPFLRARLAQQLQLKKLPLLSFTFVGLAQPDAPPPGGEP